MVIPSILTLDKNMCINKKMLMSGRRILFWTALVCAMALPLVAQAQVNVMPLVAPANGCQLSAPKCQMPNCTCPCCQQKGERGRMAGCGCHPVSLVCLPSTGANESLHRGSLNYLAFVAAIPKIITADIFRPPQA